MSQESVILVDEQDCAIGTEEKLCAHQQGLLHRAFSVFVFRRRGAAMEVLLQQRHPQKYHCGSLWTNACCSHPRPGESVVDAAQRRLQEEMGLTLPLTVVGHFIYHAQLDNNLIEHELDHVLIGYTDAVTIAFNPEEVMDYAWVDSIALQQSMASRASHYTPWLKRAYDIALRNINIAP